MSDLTLTLRQAFRSLLRAPGFTLTALVTLALGIGATTAMFATIHAALWKPLPFREPSRLVIPKTTFGGLLNPTSSAPDFFDYREQSGVFEPLCTLREPFAMTVVTTQPERIIATSSSPDLFAMLGVEPVAGRWFSPEESAPGGPVAAIVGEGYALRRFGGAKEALGQVLTSPNTGASFPIVGVAPASMDALARADLWLPLRKGDRGVSTSRGNHSYPLIGRLRHGLSFQEAQQRLDAFARGLEAQYPDTNKQKGMKLNRLQEALLGEEKGRLALLMGAVSLMLIVSCANVAGLLLARGVSRRSELAVRASLGATRPRIIGQLLSESLLLSGLAGLAGLGVAWALLRVLPVASGLASQGVPAGRLEPTILLFALGLSMVTGVLFGLPPAFRAASGNLARDLAPGRRTTFSGTRLRSALVVAQVALSLVLLMGSGLLLRSLARLERTSLGFEPRNLLVGEIQVARSRYPEAAQRVQFFETLQERLRAIPGVQAAGFISHIPLKHLYGNFPVWSPDQPLTNRSYAAAPSANCRVMLPGTLAAMGIPLREGRDLAVTDGPDTQPVAIISARLARYLYPGRSAVGQTLVMDTLGDDPKMSIQHHQVVGVVGDARLDEVQEDTAPTVYIPYRQDPGNSRLCPMIRTSLEPVRIMQEVRQVLSSLDRDIPLESLLPMEQQVGQRLATQRVAATTLAVFSIVTLALASLGLYGVLAFQVGQRVREIGVRVALGARTGQVVSDIVRQGLLLTAVGMGLGVLASLALGRVLANQLYQVSPADPASMALAGGALAATSLLAALLPALRAARVEPVEALRDA